MTANEGSVAPRSHHLDGFPTPERDPLTDISKSQFIPNVRSELGQQIKRSL